MFHFLGIVKPDLKYSGAWNNVPRISSGGFIYKIFLKKSKKSGKIKNKSKLFLIYLFTFYINYRHFLN